MDLAEFRQEAHALVDWMSDYLEGIENYPVKSMVQPKEIIRRLPESPPAQGEPFQDIFADFQKLILPGMTHWQHPSFFAYFPANSSPPSVLAEMLTAVMGAQCMVWQTSPAAAELEERVMEWLREMLGLPEDFTGVIQDTASTATLCALLTAREQKSDFAINRQGFTNGKPFRVYCSTEAHSSIEKSVKIAGLGAENLRTVEVDENFALIPEKLTEAIREDLAQGAIPLAVVAATGTTGSTAIDPLRPIAEICKQHDCWLHVDAAFAGSAMVLPELRWMIDGIEGADSFVFNPHKWLFTNFDCSAYYVKDESALIRTFEILPEYLKTPEDERVNNYRDWGIPLGRRFRALKLWFVIRTYGVEGIKQRISEQIHMARGLAEKIDAHPDFERLAPLPLSTLCFRFRPTGLDDPAAIDRLNEQLLSELNASGKLYLTHTKLGGVYTLRLVIAQTRVGQKHVDQAWKEIRERSRKLSS